MTSRFAYDFQGAGTVPTWTWTSQSGVVSGGIPATDPIHGVHWSTYPGNVLLTISYDGAAKRVELYRIAEGQGTAELVVTINLPRPVRQAFRTAATDVHPVFPERQAIVYGQIEGAIYIQEYAEFWVGLTSRTVQEQSGNYPSMWRGVSGPDLVTASGPDIYLLDYTEAGFAHTKLSRLENGTVVESAVVYNLMDSNHRFPPRLLAMANGVSPVIYGYYSPATVDTPLDWPSNKIDSLWAYDFSTATSIFLGNGVDTALTNVAMSDTGFVLSRTGKYGSMDSLEFGVMFNGAFSVDFTSLLRANFFNSFIGCVEKPGLRSDAAVPQPPPPLPPGPLNNAIANATVLTLNTADWNVETTPWHRFVLTGYTLTGATFEAGEPATPRGYPFPADSGSVWFKFTVPNLGVPLYYLSVSIDYTTDPVTGLGVTFPPFKAYADIFTSDGTIAGTNRTLYGGSTDSWPDLWDWAGDNPVIAGSDVWPLAAGQEYYIRVTSFGANPDHPQSAITGPFDLALYLEQSYVWGDKFGFAAAVAEVLAPPAPNFASQIWTIYPVYFDWYTLEAWESPNYALPQPWATSILAGTGSAWRAFTLPAVDAVSRILTVRPRFSRDASANVVSPPEFLFFIEIFDANQNNVTTSMVASEETLVGDPTLLTLGYYGTVAQATPGTTYYARVTSYGASPYSNNPLDFGNLDLEVVLSVD